MSRTSLSQLTTVVRAGIDCDASYGAVVPSLVLSSNFTFAGLGQPRQYDYTRSGNPTRDQLGHVLADLEGGAGAVITSSGIAALTLLVHAVVQANDLVVIPDDVYGGTWRLFDAFAKKGYVRLKTVNYQDTQALATVLALKPSLMLIETPSNPFLRITDLQTVIAQAHQVQARVVVDNTFLSPLLQRPMEYGADYVLHSTTKYINGHSDVVSGALIANDSDAFAQLAWWANTLGLTGAPFDAYLVMRGLRTLAARLRIHEENAHAIAAWLTTQPRVSRVYYPGLSDCPGHATAVAQQRGFGGMISFELDGGCAAVTAFVKELRYFSLAESLGGVESLIAHPATMTHAAMSTAARAQAGIGDNLLRLSVGIEDKDDLLADLAQALGKIEGTMPLDNQSRTNRPVSSSV